MKIRSRVLGSRLQLESQRKSRVNAGFKLAPRTWALAAALCAALVLVGCGKKEKYAEHLLPLPPGSDTGLYEGQFVQADYGFGFPAPAKWLYVRIAADQEADEVARFTDQSREAIARVWVRMTDGTRKFSPKVWADAAEEEWKGRQFKVKKREGAKEIKTAGPGSWSSVIFRLADPRGPEWLDQEWVLAKDELLIGVRVFIPKKSAENAKGLALLKAVEESLAKVSWYTPIGIRGISVERFELRAYSERFCRALESGSLSKTSVYFDEMYSDRAGWAKWYQEAAGAKPAEEGLKAELTGLVINGDGATASFTLTRTDKGQSAPKKFEQRFRLSKKEGSWEIVAPVAK